MTHHSAAFLLVIPGTTLAGFGIGLAAHHPAPGLLTGLGTGAILWGLLVTFRR